MTPTLSVVTLRVLITAHAALDTMEMEHHATVNLITIIIITIIIIIIIIIIVIIIIIIIILFYIKQCWFADDATGARPLEEVKEYWDELRGASPPLGYYPNSK